MAKLKVYDKNNNQIMIINVTSENSYNKTLRRKKSILDILLDNRIDVYYGCMGGSCSACVCTILSGENYIDKEGLHEQIYKGIDDDDILSCIATVKDEYIGNDDCEIEIRTKL